MDIDSDDFELSETRLNDIELQMLAKGNERALSRKGTLTNNLKSQIERGSFQNQMMNRRSSKAENNIQGVLSHSEISGAKRRSSLSGIAPHIKGQPNLMQSQIDKQELELIQERMQELEVSRVELNDNTIDGLISSDQI